jgi:hypothetical protein
MELRQKIVTIHERLCASCHDAQAVSRTDWIDIYKPENSLFLTAPRTGKCTDNPYKTADDTDYQEMLGLIREAVGKAWHFPRRDLINLPAPEHLCKEVK